MPRRDVGAAARSEADQDPDRLAGIVGCGIALRLRAERRHRDQQTCGNARVHMDSLGQMRIISSTGENSMNRGVVFAGVLVAIFACAASADEALRRQAAGLFGEIKASTAAGSPQAELGRALFWDERASLDGKTACASCHFARDWGADRRQFSPDARGELTSRHSPTVFNSVSQPTLRWLGDRKTAADQAEGSLGGSLGFPSRDAALKKLNELGYEAAFRAAFPQDAQPFSTANYGRALSAYQAPV